MRPKLILAAFLSFLAGICHADCTTGTTPTLTTRAGIPKPAINSCNWGQSINSDFDIIDASACLLGQSNTYIAANTFNSGLVIGSGQSIQFNDATTHSISLKVPSSVTTTTFNLPTTDGTSGQFLKTDGSGNLSFTSASGGSSTLAVTTGTSSGFGGWVASSPTAVINLEGTEFNGALKGGATAYLSLNVSSVTLQGNTFNQANKLVQLDGSTRLPIVDGSQLTNVTITGQLPGGDTHYWNLPSTGTFPAIYGIASTTMTVSTLTVSGLNSGECVQTGAGGILTTTGAGCLSAGASYIENTSSLQSGATFYVSSGTVNGQFILSGTNTNLIYQPGTGTGGTANLWAQGASSFAPSKFDIVYSGLSNGTTISHLLFSNGSPVGWVFENGSGVAVSSITTSGVATFASSKIVGNQTVVGNQTINNGATITGGLIVDTISVTGNTSGTYEATFSTAIGGPYHIAISTSGHFVTNGNTPTLSSCGTNPSVSGDDNEGTITVGSGVSVTACTLTFAKPWGTTPLCTESDNSTVAVGDVSSISSTAVTFSVSANLAGGLIYYRCGCSGSSCL